MILLCGAALTVFSALYATRNFAVDSSPDQMLSADLPFRKAESRFRAKFPAAEDSLLFVVDGPSLDAVEDATTALAKRLRQRPDHFRKVTSFQDIPYFRQNGLLFLDEEALNALADRLAEAQPFLGALWKDRSIRGLFDVVALAAEEAAKAAGPPPIDLTPLLNKIADVLEAQTEGRPGTLAWGQLIAGDDGGAKVRRFLNVEIVPDFTRFRSGAGAIETARAIIGDLRLDGSKAVRTRLTDTVALRDEEVVSATLGAGLSTTISFALVIILLIICYRSPRMTLASLVTLIFGLFWSTAWAVFIVGPLNLISVAFAVLFIGLSVDFGIHYALRYREARERTGEHPRSLVMAAASCGGSLTMAAVAAAIGFFSFLPTDYRGLAELGLISGSSMFIALFACFTLMPACMSIVVPRLRRSVHWRRDRDMTLADWIGRQYRGIIVVSAILAAISAALATQVRFDFDPLHLRDPESESVSTILELLADDPGIIYAVNIVTPNLEAADALSERLEALPSVGSTRTARSLVPADQAQKLQTIASLAILLEPAFSAPQLPPPNRSEILSAIRRLQDSLLPLAAHEDGTAARRMLASLAEWARATSMDGRALRELDTRLLSTLPDRIESLREGLTARAVGLDDIPAELRDHWLSPDGSARLTAYPKDAVHLDRGKLKQFVDDVRAIVPDISGESVGIYESGQAVVRSLRGAASLALLMILLLMLGLLRSVRASLLAIMPVLLALLLTAAASVVINKPFNYANVIVLPLLFGLGVAGSLHFVVRYRRLQDETEVLASSTPRAVTFSALTTVASFGSLALSPHPGTASMGILLTLALTFTLATTLLTLPAVITAITRHGASRDGTSP